MTWIWAVPSEFICLAMLMTNGQVQKFETVYDSKLRLFAFGVSDEFTKRRLLELFELQGVTYEVTN